jgi:hypothetical protein
MTDTNDQPGFPERYAAALSRAAAAFGLPEDHPTVINCASAVARLEEAEADLGVSADADGRTAADRAAGAALLARLRETTREAEAKAQEIEDTPDAEAQALARAVASLNARRTRTPAQAAPAAPDSEGGAEAAPPADQDATSTAFAKAAARLNANR